MNKQVAALEISNKYIKLVVGYVLDNKVDILYKTKRQLSVPFKDGDIFDIGSISDDLSKISPIEIDAGGNKLTINVNEVTLILPPYGLEVYKTVKSTNTVSNDSKISKIDISNALALVKKEKLANPNNSLVDIIPNKFIIDNNVECYTPPLHKVSQALTIDANVYTLPTKMIGDMRSACEKAGLSVNKAVIAPVGVATLLKGSNFKYPTYVLINMSNKTTSLSLVGEGIVYASNFFSLGIDDLVDKLSTHFGITKEKAEEIKDIYGLDLRKTNYNPFIIETVGADGITRKYTKEDVNNVTQTFLNTWVEYFNGSLKTLLRNYGNMIVEIPLVLTGEGSRMNGLREFMLKSFNTNPLEVIIIPTVSCRCPEFTSCLGAIYLSSSYRGTLEDDNRQKVQEVTRAKDSSKVEKYDELKDEL